MKKIILFIIIIGLILAFVGFWQWQKNRYSKEILKLEILAPEQAEIFDEVVYTVKYKNNGNIRLEDPHLIFEFPENTLSSDEEGKFIRRKEAGAEELGDIYPGEEKTFQFRARLFGKKGEIKTAKAWLNYRPKNLKARYESATTFSTTISSVPLTFNFDLPSKVEAERDFKFSLNYFSNLYYPLSNLGVKIEYPSGFEFSKSFPDSLDKTEWEIPLLNKNEGGKITIEGKLSGELKEQKVFKAMLGVWRDGEFILLKEITRGAEIVKPRLFVFQQVNGSSNYVAEPGDSLHYEIFFRNISDEPYLNLFLAVNLEGNVFDFESVKSDYGKFRKGDNSIVWDWTNTSELRFLDRGEEGKVDFWIDLKDWKIESSAEKNVVLKNDVLISHVKEEFEVKLNSKLAISQKGYFQDEVFGNSGPLPPEVGKKTTYTVIWKAENYYNDVENATVKAVLPANVELTGKIFPEEEAAKLSFNESSREVIWRLGESQKMEGGTGILNSAPNVAFQVALIPEASQKGRRAEIIKKAVIKAEDQWTERIIKSEAPALTTRMPDDPTVSGGKGIVR